MSTICEACGKKVGFVIGNVKFDGWVCELCDEDIEITGKIPEKFKKTKTKKK